MEGGLAIGAWLALWRQSYALTAQGIWRSHWPSDSCTLEQPSITVSMFDLITELTAQTVFSSGHEQRR